MGWGFFNRTLKCPAIWHGFVGKVFGKFFFFFEVDAFRKHCLVNGLDDIGLTLQKSNAIEIYEDKRVKQAPWTFAAA